MNRMDALARWFLIGLALLALVGALRWISTECREPPAIGSVVKIWGC